MDSKVPVDTFEKVLELATEGAKAVATYMREVSLLADDENKSVTSLTFPYTN